MSVFDSSSQRTLIGRFLTRDIESGMNAIPVLETSTHALNEDLDVNSLSPGDLSCYRELQIIEDCFLNYQNAPLNIAQLQFGPDSASRAAVPVEPDASSQDILELIDILPGTSPHTKQLSYCVHGYHSLIARLKNFHTSTDFLESYRSNLAATILAELDKLQYSVNEERYLQLSQGSHYQGLRRVNFSMSKLIGAFW